MPDNEKKYDLEERTEKFASDVGDFVDVIAKSIQNVEYAKQVVRSSGSVASNYIEANDSLSKRDFIYRVKICKKEAKETRLWLRLIRCTIEQMETQDKLIQESTELMKIFAAIISKSE